MGRKNRELAGFQEVAKIKNINDNININDNENVNNDENEETVGDYLDKLMNDKQQKEAPIKPTGFYLDPDIKKVIDKIGEKGGRGAKSQVVNDGLRFYFKQKGLME